MLSEPAPALSSIRPGLGEGWDQLVARLLAADAGERPASAREVLREVIRLSAGADTPAEVDLGVPYPEGDPLAGIFVGRRIERAALRAALDRLADGAAPVSTLALVGPPGAGRRALFDVVARELAVAGAAGTAPVVQLWRGSFDALAAWLQPGAAEPVPRSASAPRRRGWRRSPRRSRRARASNRCASGWTRVRPPSRSRRGPRGRRLRGACCWRCRRARRRRVRSRRPSRWHR